MQTTTEDLADYDHRLMGALQDLLVNKGVISSAEVAQMNRSIEANAGGPRAAAVKYLADLRATASGG